METYLTIKPIGTNRFQVIGKNINVTGNSRQSMSTTFYAETREELNSKVEKLKVEYQLSKVTIGKNNKGENILIIK